MIGIFTYTFTINLSHMYGKHASHMEHMGVEIFFSHRNDTHTQTDNRDSFSLNFRAVYPLRGRIWDMFPKRSRK